MNKKLGVHGLSAGPVILANVGKWVNATPPSNLPAGYTAIFRWVENPDNVNDQMGNGDPEGSARAWVDKQASHFASVPQSAYIEGPNENNCENRSQADWYSRFEIERMRLMESRGYKCCIGNFGTGRPPLPTDPGGVEIWNELAKMMRYAKSNGHIASFHEYDDELSTWWFLRYRRYYNWLSPDARPDLVVTEWGLESDFGTFREQNWRNRQADPDAAYFALMKAYDLEMQKDSYARGFLIFTGPSDPNWRRFDISGQPVVRLIENYLQEDHPMPITRTLNVADVAFWEMIRNSDQGTHDPKDDHRSTILALLKEQGAQVNIGLGLVDIVFPNRLSFDRYDPVIYRDARGPGLKDAGIPIAMGMLDTLPSHMNVGGHIDRRFEAELRTAIRGIVTHFKDIIHRWAVGNELVGWTLDDYIWFLDVVTDAILSADANARVAAALPLSQYGSTDHTTPFAQGILARSQGKFHSWSVHPYADDHNDVAINEDLVEWFLTHDTRTLWITEWGKSKDRLLPHWNDSKASLLRVEQMQSNLFVAGYDYLAAIPRVELISYHRLLDVPQASYGMVSQGVWDGEGYHKFLIFNAAKDLYAGVITPPIPEPPIEEPAMPNTIANPLFAEKDANGLSLVVVPPWPNMSGRILKPWRVLRVADRNTPKLNVNGTPGVDGVQDMDWQFGEYIDISAGQAPDILPAPKGRMYKMFRGPHWGSIGQDITFTLAGTYRLATTIWPDSVLFYNPKTYSHPEPGHDDWHLGFEFRQGVIGITPTNAPFLTLKDLTPGRWNTPTVDFVIPNAGVHTVFFEMRCRWALANAGGFVQEVSLTPVSVTPPPDPEPTPVLPPIGTNYTGPEQNAVLDALRQKVGV